MREFLRLKFLPSSIVHKWGICRPIFHTFYAPFECFDFASPSTTHSTSPHPTGAHPIYAQLSLPFFRVIILYSIKLRIINIFRKNYFWYKKLFNSKSNDDTADFLWRLFMIHVLKSFTKTS